MWWCGYENGEHSWKPNSAKSLPTPASVGSMLAMLPRCLVDGVYMVMVKKEGKWVGL